MMKRTLISLLAAIVLVGCTSDKIETPISKTVFNTIKSKFAPKANMAEQRRAVESVTREQFIGVGKNPFILVDIEVSQQYATLNQVSVNGDFNVFISADNKTITFSKGLIVATRGLGADLTSLDASQTRAALFQTRGNSNATTRIHRMMNGVNQLETTVFTCALVNHGLENLTSIHKQFQLIRYQENCTSAGADGVSYTNTYWIHPTTRIMWKSRQWAGPVIGYLGVEVLIPSKS